MVTGGPTGGLGQYAGTGEDEMYHWPLLLPGEVQPGMNPALWPGFEGDKIHLATDYSMWYLGAGLAAFILVIAAVR